MRKYAIIDDMKVVEIVSMDEAECAEVSRKHMAVVDVEDTFPRPEVGWVLEGNTISPSEPELTSDQKDDLQQKAQREYGEKLLPIAIDKIGARNLRLSREGNGSDIAAFAVQMQTIKLLLEGGALKTVRGVCSALRPSFPNHADILDFVIVEITNFLTANGYQ